MRSWRIILMTCALLWGGVDAFSSRAPFVVDQACAEWNSACGVTEEVGLATGYGYDALSRLTLVTNALAKVTSFQFDIAGNETNQIDALSRPTKFSLDALGRRTQRTLPLAVSEGLRYDKASRVLAQTNFNGTIITNQYDGLGRLWKRWNGATPLETNTYSALGQLITRLDASGAHTWVYDALGRLKTNSTPAGTLYYTYDAAGNLLTLGSGTSSGVTNQYQYDALNRLTNVVDVRLATATKNTGYGFDAVGNLQWVKYNPNGVTNLYQYDALNRLTNLVWSKTNTLRAGFGYTLGAAGNRLTLAETNSGSIRSYTWGYDNAYRLTSEQIATTAPTGTLSYGYDDVGNRVTRTGTLGSLGAQSFNYDQRDQIDNDATPTTASIYFDANGNTRTNVWDGAARQYGYDWANRLTTFTNAATTVTVTYDAGDNRIKKVAGGVTTWYLVATVNPTGYPQVVEELTGATPTTLSKVYCYGLDLIDQRQQPAGTVSFYGYDGLGSVKFLTDTTGAITDTYTYDASGNTLTNSAPTSNNYRYTGEQWDPDLGLYYLRARYLNPTIGRFQTRDTFEGRQGDPLSLHQYLYCVDNPINRIDPSGMVDLNLASLSTAITTMGGLAATYVSRVGPRVTEAFGVGSRQAGVLFNEIGAFAQNQANQVLRLIQTSAPNLRMEENVRVGNRVIDFVVRYGNQVAQIEVKYGLPYRQGPALARLVGQVEAAATQGEGQIVLWTLRPPTIEQIKLVTTKLGTNADRVQFVNGVEGLFQWAQLYFGF